jgi:hypothetical protein
VTDDDGELDGEDEELDDDDEDFDDEDFDEFEDEFRDDEDGRAGPREPTLHPAVMASNWWAVLLVDAACGAAVLVVGLVLMVVWNLYVGAFVASAALVYVLLVGRRALQWRWLRRQAGS